MRKKHVIRSFYGALELDSVCSRQRLESAQGFSLHMSEQQCNLRIQEQIVLTVENYCAVWMI